VAKILIADDSPTELKLLERALASSGHEILLAADGEEAETIIHRDRPDLLILDIVMPRKNGFQICRDLKADPELRDIKVIMVTSKDQDSDRFWGLKQGADEYVVKPFDPDLLRNLVGGYLG